MVIISQGESVNFPYISFIIFYIYFLNNMYCQ